MHGEQRGGCQHRLIQFTVLTCCGGMQNVSLVKTLLSTFKLKKSGMLHIYIIGLDKRTEINQQPIGTEYKLL